MSTQPIRVAINGFGRIGRTFFKQALDDEAVSITAINDIGDVANLVYLLRYDSAYGRYDREVSCEKSESGPDHLIIDGERYPVLNEKDPKNLPWKDYEIDVVVESTGIFDEKEKAAWHLEAGAKRVVISANAEGDVPHKIVGANEIQGVEDKITSDGSCTTNAIVPLAALMEEHVGVEKGFLSTVHGYTASQNTVDGPSSKWERGRAAAQNIVLTTTSAAKAAPKALPFLSDDNFDGYAIRVPVLVGSVAEFFFLTKQDTTAEELNNIFREASKEKRWEKTLSVTEEKIVSSDIIGEKYGAIVALQETKVLGGNFAKVVAWYDNEWGYAHTLLEHLKEVGIIAQAE